MGDYIPRISKRPGNLIFNRDDGTVWANYLLRGINTNPYDTDKVEACQADNDLLFSQLSKLPASDFLLLGIKAQTPHDTVMARCVADIPGFNEPGRYPDLLAQYNALYSRLISGEHAEFQRVFLLSIGFPVSRSIIESLMSSVAVTDPHRNVSNRAIEELEERYFRALPRQFMPARTTPDHVRWVWDRARQRGITVPSPPDPTVTRAAADGPRSFAEVMINKNADTDALYEDLVAKVADDNPAVMTRGRSGLPGLGLIIAFWVAAMAAHLLPGSGHQWISPGLTLLAVAATVLGSMRIKQTGLPGRHVLRENFRSTRWARALSVHNVETRSPEFPDGYTSYQTQLAIARFPSVESFGINSFTYLVDQEIGVDADFALRFDFSQELVTKTGMRKARKELDAEDNANTQDEFDAEDYADRRTEMGDFRRAVKDEPAARGMRIAAIFSFAHQNREFLAEQVDAIIKHFTDHDFTPLLPVGGQFDLWQAMMPGASCPPTVEDLKQTTTVRLFSACMPVRRTVLGDPIGVPIAINKENALGQIVHWDILNATDKGNASTAFCGAQGAGKSEGLKVTFGFMIDMRRPAWAVDQTDHGELEVFAQTLTEPEIIHIADPTASSTGPRSLDPLKCFPPALAAQLFMDWWLPLLRGIDEASEEADLLSTLLVPEYRKAVGLHSTRDLLDHLTTKTGAASRNLQLAFGFWARQPYTHAFIDPVINGKTIEYEAFNPTKLCVIFRTHQLSVYRPGDGVAFEDAEASQRFTAMAYTVIARLTAKHFSEIKGPCGFFGDEMKFLKGSAVLKTLIEQPDRTGRKGGNFVVAAAQLAEDFDDHYKLIRRKVMLRQETRPNAAAALEWGDLPPTDKLVTRMVSDTSPPDPERNNMPRRGREGEGWYNDGNNNTGRVKFLGHLRADRRRYSNTTSSQMIRANELRQLQPATQAAPNGDHPTPPPTHSRPPTVPMP